MPDLDKFDFSRARGIVWVCDLVGSSKFMNEDQSVDALEVFLPRLYWIASMAVDAAGGKFIKWTGDGFLAWFETPLHRDLHNKSAAVFDAVWHLTVLVNITQLGLKPKQKFKIRHGVTYEQDALLIKIKHKGGFETLDLLGRDVVLAFRLSGIPAEFPGIVTKKELVIASTNYRRAARDFIKWSAKRDEKLKYFKGERWGTDDIYTSVDKLRRARDPKALLRQVKKVIAETKDTKQVFDKNSDFVKRFLENMMEGPEEWCREVIDEYIRYIKEDMFVALRKVVPLLEEINKFTTTKQRRKS